MPLLKKSGLFSLVIATSNPHKVKEFQKMLDIPCLHLQSLSDFPDYIPPEETGKTFEENASLKAVHAAKSLNRRVIADDSGLCVHALNGDPGVYSARYSDPNATDRKNRQKLIAAMEHVKDRKAYFECCIALATPKGDVRCVCEKCYGEITAEERGDHGFGYDSLFIKTGETKTFAEMDEETKNRLSHRKMAIDKLIPILKELL